MSKTKYFLYTDASFSHFEACAVSGFLFFNSESSHEKSKPATPGIRTHFFKESNNIRAEISGAIYGLKIFIEQMKNENTKLESIEVCLFSDCQTLTKLLSRREKLVAADYLSARKKTILANADLYKLFFLIHDEVRPVIHWVKGHSKRENQSLIQKNFQIVDRQVRKELRDFVKNKNIR